VERKKSKEEKSERNGDGRAGGGRMAATRMRGTGRVRSGVAMQDGVGNERDGRARGETMERAWQRQRGRSRLRNGREREREPGPYQAGVVEKEGGEKEGRRRGETTSERARVREEQTKVIKFAPTERKAIFSGAAFFASLRDSPLISPFFPSSFSLSLSLYEGFRV